MTLLRSDRSEGNAPQIINLRLRSPEELFWVDGSDFRHADARLQPALEQLVDRLSSHWKFPHLHIVVTVPSGSASGWSDGNLEAAVRRYCTLRIEGNNREVDKLRWQGLSALRLGAVLFGIGLVVSYLLTRHDVPEIWQTVLGYGVFLVVAWVALWQPLDTLLFSRKPLRREQRVLEHLADTPFSLVEE